MKIITIDFETYWSPTFSVSKLSPLEYVLGDEFEIISCAFKVDDGPSKVLFGREAIEAEFAALDVESNALLAHNMSGFDAYICAYVLKLKPRLWMCTAAMSRPINSKTVGNSLAQLVKKYNVGVKNGAILLATKGKHLKDFTPEELRDMATYNGEDVDQCYAVYQKLRPHYSSAELWQIDATIRMRTEPAFVLDQPLMRATLTAEKLQKRNALVELANLLKLRDAGEADEDKIVEFVRSELASAPKFSKLLEARGVATPYKPSPSNPEKQVPALAKTDAAFLDLQEHDDPVVAAAARTRLAIKSTLLETRIEKFLQAADLTGGLIPAPIRIYGADTTGRDSGEEYNLQNMPRIGKTPKLSDALRTAITAPPGFVIGVADQSGIELRVNHTLWQVTSSMDLWRDDPKGDLYRAFAAVQFNIDPAEVTSAQRQLAKVEQLGLGFGAGAQTFQRIAKVQGGLDLSLVEARESVQFWRETYWKIAHPRDGGWRKCHSALPRIRAGQAGLIDPWGLCNTEKDAIVLPSGRRIRYPGLREEEVLDADGNPTGKREWYYGYGRHKARIYGPKIDENIVQALARDSIFDAAIQFYKLTGYRPKLRVHDELVYIWPAAEAPRLLAQLQGILRKPPKWWPELVTWSEGGFGANYGVAKS